VARSLKLSWMASNPDFQCVEESKTRHTHPSTTLVTCYPFHLSIYWAVSLAIHRPRIPANSDPSEICMSTKMEDCEGS
jgi:hypothetical protein